MNNIHKQEMLKQLDEEQKNKLEMEHYLNKKE